MKYSDVPTYGAGDVVGSSLTDDRQPMDVGILAKINSIPHVRTRLTVTLTDARGNPKPHKRVVVASDGKLAVEHEYSGPDPLVIEVPPEIDVSYSSSAGKAEVILSCTPECDSFTGSVERDVLLVTVGEASRPYWEGTLQAGEYSSLPDVGVTAHENNLESLSYTRNLDNRSAMAIPMPMINHYHYMVFKQAVQGDVYASDHDMEGTIPVINVNLVDVQKMRPETPCLALRLREAAKALGVSPRLLSEWVRQGTVPCARIGGVVVFPVDTLRAWLQRQAEGDRVTGEYRAENGT